jgi:hypothetical protein
MLDLAVRRHGDKPECQQVQIGRRGFLQPVEQSSASRLPGTASTTFICMVPVVLNHQSWKFRTRNLTSG